jgi:hypothetical protein
MHLRLQDFKTVTAYKAAVFRIKRWIHKKRWNGFWVN